MESNLRTSCVPIGPTQTTPPEKWGTLNILGDKASFGHAARAIDMLTY